MPKVCLNARQNALWLSKPSTCVISPTGIAVSRTSRHARALRRRTRYSEGVSPNTSRWMRIRCPGSSGRDRPARPGRLKVRTRRRPRRGSAPGGAHAAGAAGSGVGATGCGRGTVAGVRRWPVAVRRAASPAIRRSRLRIVVVRHRSRRSSRASCSSCRHRRRGAACCQGSGSRLPGTLPKCPAHAAACRSGTARASRARPVPATQPPHHSWACCAAKQPLAVAACRCRPPRSGSHSDGPVAWRARGTLRRRRPAGAMRRRTRRRQRRGSGKCVIAQGHDGLAGAAPAVTRQWHHAIGAKRWFGEPLGVGSVEPIGSPPVAHAELFSALAQRRCRVHRPACRRSSRRRTGRRNRRCSAAMASRLGWRQRADVDAQQQAGRVASSRRPQRASCGDGRRGAGAVPGSRSGSSASPAAIATVAISVPTAISTPARRQAELAPQTSPGQVQPRRQRPAGHREMDQGRMQRMPHRRQHRAEQHQEAGDGDAGVHEHDHLRCDLAAQWIEAR